MPDAYEIPFLASFLQVENFWCEFLTHMKLHLQENTGVYGHTDSEGPINSGIPSCVQGYMDASNTKPCVDGGWSCSDAKSCATWWLLRPWALCADCLLWCLRTHTMTRVLWTPAPERTGPWHSPCCPHGSCEHWLCLLLPHQRLEPPRQDVRSLLNLVSFKRGTIARPRIQAHLCVQAQRLELISHCLVSLCAVRGW